MGFRILVGLIGVPAGFLMLYYRDKIKGFTGNISWAEKYLGQGGTWTALILISVGISLFSFMFMIGKFQEIFLQFFGRFF
jgi:hypothetical protein